jgi:hypothetical protein
MLVSEPSLGTSVATSGTREWQDERSNLSRVQHFDAKKALEVYIEHFWENLQAPNQCFSQTMALQLWGRTPRNYDHLTLKLAPLARPNGKKLVQFSVRGGVNARDCSAPGIVRVPPRLRTMTLLKLWDRYSEIMTMTPPN